MPTSPTVNVEQAFADVVRSIGGEVVEDIVGPSPDFLNADYIFRDLAIVAELKRIVEDKSEDDALQAKIQAKFDGWMADGTLLVYGRTVIQSDSLPPAYQRELMDIYKPSLKRRLLKANKQIKQTRAKLGMESAKGLVILVNDGSYALEANALLYVINRILGTSFSAINSIVYCTVNVFSTTPLTPKPALVWVHATRQSVLPPVDSELVMSLFRSWLAYLQHLVGHPIEEVLVPSNKEVDNLRYARRI